MSMRILFTAKGSFDSGNYVTMTRIKNNLELLNKYIVTKYHDLTELSQFNQIHDEFNPDVIIGLNVYRCLFLLDILKPITKLILILGGTDINCDFPECDINIRMEKLILRSQYVVAFSKEMIQIFEEKFPNVTNQVKMKLIPQGLSQKFNIPDKFAKHKMPLSCHGLEEDIRYPYFVIAGRLRDVKDPEFALNPFLEWQKLPENNDYKLLYIGSIEEESESIQSFLARIKNMYCVKHYPSISQPYLFYILKQSSGLINCSKNEGQCTVILEAMKLGVLVIARKIPGNVGLIEDNTNGFLFTTTQNLQNALERSKDKESIYHLTKNAKIYVEKYHDALKEAKSYFDIIS